MQGWTKIRKQRCHSTIKFQHLGYDVAWLSSGVELNTIAKTFLIAAVVVDCYFWRMKIGCFCWYLKFWDVHQYTAFRWSKLNWGKVTFKFFICVPWRHNEGGGGGIAQLILNHGIKILFLVHRAFSVTNISLPTKCTFIKTNQYKVFWNRLKGPCICFGFYETIIRGSLDCTYQMPSMCSSISTRNAVHHVHFW
jgi:hypothetical protein